MAISEDALAQAAATLAAAIWSGRQHNGTVGEAASEAAEIFTAVLTELREEHRPNRLGKKVVTRRLGGD